MQYSTVVEHSEEGLNLILERAAAFDRASVLDGLLARKYSVYEIEQMTADVQEYHARLRKEINAVVNFAQVFNRQFSTDNNKCFEVAERLFRKIRSSVAGTKRIYRRFCKVMRTRFPGTEGCQKASVFTHSILVSGRFTKDLFGECSFPRVVTTLCDELESFFADLVQIIMVCQEVSREEIRLRENPTELVDLYMSDRNCTRSLQQSVIELMKEQMVECQSDRMTSYKKTHSLQAFLREMFHRSSRKEFTMHIVNEELESGRLDGLDVEESALWPEHHDFVPKVRVVIEHFDELEPKGRKDNASGMYKIDGKAMARLVRWCHLEDTRFEKTFVEGYFRKHYHGAFLPINANTVNTAKNKFTKAGGDDGYEGFKQKVEGLLTRYAPTKKSA